MTPTSYLPQSVVFATHAYFFDGAATALRIMSSSESFGAAPPPVGMTTGFIAGRAMAA